MAGVITDTVSSAPASCTSTIASYPKSLSTSVKEVDDDNEISNRGRAFSSVPMGVVDPDEILLRRIRADDSPNKINIMPGVFTDENGGYYEFEAIRKAKDILTRRRLGHDYISIFGVPELRQGAQRLIFGKDHPRIQQRQIATLQTVAGCGANRIGAAFLKHHFPGSFAYEEKSGNTAKVYIGTPGWSNHVPLFRHAGFEVETYRHYDPVSCGVDFEALLASLRTAADQSIFVLQASCHNPTGADLTRDQWMTVAAEMRARRHFPFFDISYGGFGTAVPDGGYSDVWAIRHFVDQGFDLVVAQTFSKCMGLYGERVGCLHFACASEDIANRVLDQARCLVRWEYSSPPAFPGRLVGCILSDEGLEASWKEELAMATRRIGRARRELYEWLTVRLSTPGNWECILMGTGMFSFLPLSAQHVEHLAQKSHVWMPRNGRMNMAGLTPKNIELVARAIDAAVRELATL